MAVVGRLGGEDVVIVGPRRPDVACWIDGDVGEVVVQVRGRGGDAARDRLIGPRVPAVEDTPTNASLLLEPDEDERATNA